MDNAPVQHYDGDRTSRLLFFLPVIPVQTEPFSWQERLFGIRMSTAGVI